MISVLIFIGVIAVVAIVYAGGIDRQPPATAAERRCWPADVKEDTGEYRD